MARLRAALPVTFVLCVCIAATARAGGIEFPDFGTIAVGRGGAVAANPDDGIAIEQNPAGLAFQHGLHVTADANLTNMKLTFAPADGSAATSNSAGWFPAPGGTVSYGLGGLGPISGLTFALGAVGPSAVGKLNYSATDLSRYELISSNYFIAYYSVAVAASIFHKLAVGVTFQLAQGTAQFSQAAWAGIGSGTGPNCASSASACQDAIANVNVKSGVIPTAVIGATFKPIEMVAIGASFRPGFTFNGDGTLVNTLPSIAQQLGVTQHGDSATLSLNFPNVLRVGAQVKFWRALVEADYVFEQWSTLQYLTITPHNITLTDSLSPGQSSTLAPINIPEHFTNTSSVRLGGDIEVLSHRLWLRAGYLYETDGIPPQYVTIAFGNWGRQAVSGGVSIAIFGGIYIDAAYAHHFIPTQNVTNSQVYQLSPSPPPPGIPASTPSIIGNGKYTASFDVVSIGLRLVLDDMRMLP